MPKVTFKVSETTWRRTRVWAAERDTSVSEIVQYLIENLPSLKRANRAFPLPNAKSAPVFDKSPSK